MFDRRTFIEFLGSAALAMYPAGTQIGPVLPETYPNGLPSWRDQPEWDDEPFPFEEVVFSGVYDYQGSPKYTGRARVYHLFNGIRTPIREYISRFDLDNGTIDVQVKGAEREVILVKRDDGSLDTLKIRQKFPGKLAAELIPCRS